MSTRGLIVLLFVVFAAMLVVWFIATYSVPGGYNNPGVTQEYPRSGGHSHG